MECTCGACGGPAQGRNARQGSFRYQVFELSRRRPEGCYVILFGRTIAMRLVFKALDDPRRQLNCKKSIQYPSKQLPCQISGGSVQRILSEALTPTDPAPREHSHVSTPDRILFNIGSFAVAILALANQRR